MNHHKRIMNNQKGFTLIEIIAVLILLGILAAVAVPKYVDLQQDAKNKAAEGAVAEGIAQVNQYAAKHILANSTVPTTLAQLITAGLVDPYAVGDFSIDFVQAAAGDPITVNATGIAGTAVDGAAATRDVPLPQ